MGNPLKGRVFTLTVLSAVLVITSGCASGIAGTWRIDLTETMKAVREVPEREVVGTEFKSIESYKRELTEKIYGLEITFTTRRSKLKDAESERLTAGLNLARLKQGEKVADIYWKDDGVYSLYDLTFKSDKPRLVPCGKFDVRGNSACWAVSETPWAFLLLKRATLRFVKRQ